MWPRIVRAVEDHGGSGKTVSFGLEGWRILTNLMYFPHAVVVLLIKNAPSCRFRRILSIESYHTAWSLVGRGVLGCNFGNRRCVCRVG